MINIHFEQATLNHKDLIFSWLDKPHIQEFWDNSIEHRQDIEIFMQGRQVKSPYFNGCFTYWIGSINNEPYCLIMTSEILADDGCNELWQQHLSKKGKTFGIDFCMGNEKYLGQKLAAPTLNAFTEFFKNKIEPQADSFFIDPDDNNLRAKNVYDKAGFKQVGEFIMESGVFTGNKNILMVKRL